ncbi:hypothetical protein VFES401_01225 [Aliivibrio fischeri]|uniref:TIGR04326 family surface carbohydrate biosynthesis protein n=1 Tax=Aliivibrio fischeri TaxID=668 RepID=UPI00107E87B6|nr:TIGR04326 family surface carbohydrate biosynthesis protein [Aliivibrio fischeri]TGA73360.1 hypothetical protein VFES401_01225 [Aliivibrio fischeri]
MIKCRLNSKLPLVILDKEEKWNEQSANVVYWADIGAEKDCFYIPLLVEQYSDELKAEYIELIDHLGYSEINGISLKDALKQKEGFSFWWMTLLSEKSPWKSDDIYAVFRALILKRLIENFAGDKIVVQSNNKKLIEWIRAFTEKKEIVVELVSFPQRFSFDWKKQLPQSMLALVYLFRTIFTCKGQLFNFKEKLIQTDFKKSINTIISYSDNLNAIEFQKGKVVSGYWGKLDEEIISQGSLIQWLMLYAPTKDFPTFKSIIKARDDGFNDSEQSVLFVEEFLSFRVIVKIFRRYLKLRKSASAYHSLIDDKSSVLFFLSKDWDSSVRGIAAMDACIKYSLFEAAVSSLPIIDNIGKGIYLYENQAWERALVHLWKQASKQELFGFQHVSGKFYDLRPFDGYGSNRQLTYNNAPLPDKVVVIGQAAVNDMVSFQYPEERVVIAESLRNLYLASLNKKAQIKTEIKTLLVVTDYLESVSDEQIKLLAESWSIVEKLFSKVLIKPHPNCPVDKILQKYELARKNLITIEFQSLESLWVNADVVYASNVTGAALEAAYMDLPTLVHLDGGFFNMSPLRGVEGVSFVATVKDFTMALNDLNIPQIPSDYMCLDLSLKKWASLLKS